MSTPYTPTTEQVRALWASAGTEIPAAKAYTRDEAAAEFDRWLARVKEDAIRQCAIRTVPLLEQAWDDGNGMGLDGWAGPESGRDVDESATARREQLVDQLVDQMIDRYCPERTEQ